LSLNPYYEGVEECDNIFFFGSDGSNYGFGFLRNSGEVVGIDFLVISHKKPVPIAVSFELFLMQLNGI
jgi:hypothetical protein